MRKISAIAVLMLVFTSAFAQFSVDQLQLRFGYNVHNAYAKRFNHLVDVFNNERYPAEISHNLHSLNWMHGFVFGGTYKLSDDLSVHAVFKGRRQLLEAAYHPAAPSQAPMFRQYLFRQHTLEVGVTLPIREEKRFSHFYGFGLLLGNLGVYTDFTPESGYSGARNMVNIDQTGVVGLSLHYEAQLKLHDHFRIFLRPVLQYALQTRVRQLTDFFAPTVDDGVVTYGPGEAEKYDKGSLNGLAIETGLLILLP